MKATLPKRDACPSCLIHITVQPSICFFLKAIIHWSNKSDVLLKNITRSLESTPNTPPPRSADHQPTVYREINRHGISQNIFAESDGLRTSTSNKVDPYPGQLLSISMYCFWASSWSMPWETKETRLASKVPELFYASFMTSFGRIWQLKKKTIEQNGTWKYYVLYLSFKRFKKKINRKLVTVQVFSIAVLIGDAEKSLKYCKLNRNFVNKIQAGWRLICWLFTKRKGVGFRITKHKSI